MFVKRLDPEIMSGMSERYVKLFIERQKKRERKSLLLAYAFLILIGTLGVHRVYLKQYKVALLIFFLAFILPAFSILISPYLAEFAFIIALLIIGFELASLWHWVAKANENIDRDIEEYYAASVF